MTPDPEQSYGPLEPPRHVESVTPLSERVSWKTEQENNKRRRKRKPKRRIDEQLSDDIVNEKDTNSEGHIDFRA